LVLWTPDIDATSYLSGCGKCALLSFYDRHRSKLTAPLLFVCVCICLPILPSTIRGVLSLNCCEYQGWVAASPVCEQVTNTMSEYTWRDHNSDCYEEKTGFVFGCSLQHETKVGSDLGSANGKVVVFPPTTLLSLQHSIGLDRTKAPECISSRFIFHRYKIKAVTRIFCMLAPGSKPDSNIA
jgi:hypothetical protein